MGINGRLAVFVFLAACGGSTFDSGTTTSGSGGSNAVGGSSGSGGSTTSGGSSNSGGDNQTGGSSNSGGMTNSGGSNQTGGSTTTSGGSTGSGGSTVDLCNALDSALNTKLAEAQVCTGNVAGECSSTVRGSCNCPVFVASPTSAVTADYLTALDNYWTKCLHSCPAMPCATGIGICGATTGTVRRCILRTSVDGG
jgi:hypothetical protein